MDLIISVQVNKDMQVLESYNKSSCIAGAGIALYALLSRKIFVQIQYERKRRFRSRESSSINPPNTQNNVPIFILPNAEPQPNPNPPLNERANSHINASVPLDHIRPDQDRRHRSERKGEVYLPSHHYRDTPHRFRPEGKSTTSHCYFPPIYDP